MADVLRCRVCGEITPPGHKICDTCWPEKAVAAGTAAHCAGCGRPKLIERLVPGGNAGVLLCAECQRVYVVTSDIADSHDG